jgi:hypothetical protein
MKSLISSFRSSIDSAEALRQKHWTSESSYPEWWIERSRLLLSLLRSSPYAATINSYSEYGCGPRRPFANSLLAVQDEANCFALDLRQWDDKTIVADLNNAKADSLPHSKCGVLSGVIEYLNRPHEVLRELSNVHEYLLFSYCFSSFDGSKRVGEKVQLLGQRAAKGWRNHMSVEELVACVSSFGYICEISHWRDQVLVFVARFDQN